MLVIYKGEECVNLEAHAQRNREIRIEKEEEGGSGWQTKAEKMCEGMRRKTACLGLPFLSARIRGGTPRFRAIDD